MALNFKTLLEIAESGLRSLTTISKPDFRLEQAEYKKDEQAWDVIVSFLVENTNKRIASVVGLAADFQFHRIYKRVKINDNGEIIGMYIYNNKG